MKSEELKIENARELVADRVLWPRIRDFLWDFAPQIHESWIEGLGGGTLDAGREGETAASQAACLMSSPRTKRYVIETLGVEPCFHTFPKGDFSRLLLLDPQTLLGISKWMGALAGADSLRRITDGATVRALKTALSGVYPEVFSYTAYFRGKTAGQSQKFENPESVIRAGVAMLHAFAKDLSEPLRRRLILKLPKEYADIQFSAIDFQPSTFNLQLLLKLRFPEAYTLCCS